MTTNDQLQALRERLGGAIRAEREMRGLGLDFGVCYGLTPGMVRNQERARTYCTVETQIEVLLVLGYDMPRIAEIVKGELGCD